MKQTKKPLAFAVLGVMLASGWWMQESWADPCGMVPPLTMTAADAITRTGAQKTYVFYKNGVESFVIRPGFKGKVDNFGMLIPFPTPPAIRKVPDHLFSHIAAAVDPPEVQVYVRSPWRRMRVMRQSMSKSAPPRAPLAKSASKKENWVRVLRQEAVGMYQVAVLEAGSPKALKTWMDRNAFRYPKGMDTPVGEYVKAGWCFVAVKTRVSGKKGVAPRPGQRSTSPSMPPGASFDGHVQGMGFRFKTKTLVVPMRLSAFNKGRTRNIVYLLTDAPRQIKHIPSKLVVRQIAGPQLYDNVTGPLPIRVVGMNNGEPQKLVRRELLRQYSKKLWLQQRRNPKQHNGLARSLFASDLLSASSGQLILDFEVLEKSFVNIGELLQLRGPELDKLHRQTLQKQAVAITQNSLAMLKGMTLTVVDGDFPRKVLARDNLHFHKFKMEGSHNTPRHYNARLARADRSWTHRRLYHGEMTKLRAAGIAPRSAPETWLERIGLLLGVVCLFFVLLIMMRKVNRVASVVIWLSLGLGTAGFLSRSAHASKPKTPTKATAKQPKAAAKQPKSAAKPAKNEAKTQANTTASAATPAQLKAWVADLGTPTKAMAAKHSLQRAGADALPYLWGAAVESPKLVRRGWAIATMAHIGGKDVQTKLRKLYTNPSQPALVRTWAAAGYINQIQTLGALTSTLREVSRLGIRALGRPVSKRIIALTEQPKQSNNMTETLLELATNRLFRKYVSGVLLKQPIERLVRAMVEANVNKVRRMAAAVLASFRSKESQGQIIKELNQQLAFHPLAKDIPWSQGALFVPRLRWVLHKAAAKQFFKHMMAWFLWCDARNKSGCQRQIHNNIRSWGIAAAVGYRPTWRFRKLGGWLRVYKRLAGKGAVGALFKQQKLLKDPRYTNMRQSLGL